MAETVYNVYKAGLAKADEDWENADYRAILLRGALTINPDHDTVADVIAANDECDDASYARQALGAATVTLDDANNRANLDAPTIDFGALDNETPTACLIYRHVTNDGDSIPVSIHDTGFGSPSNGAGYTVEWPNDVIRIS